MPDDRLNMEAMWERKSAAWTRRVSLIALNSLPLLACANEDRVLDRFYGWPPSPDFPTTDHDRFWEWSTAPIGVLPESPALDLRRLNEPVAGQSGWVRRHGDKLLLGDGTPARFWAVNSTGDAPMAQLEWFSAQLARRGVNMVRIHGGASKSLLDRDADHLFAVNRPVVDQMHKAVVAAKREGIYTFVSNTLFIIEFKIKARYGLEGYTQEWLDANPDRHVPFGLLFFNDKLKAAFRHWVRALATAPNPYDPDHTPLAQDPAVAIFEIQNEDNLFFWTFNPQRWPKAQRDLAGRQFFRWVAREYGRFGEAEHETAARLLARWDQPMPEDAADAGILALGSAADMVQRERGGGRWEAQTRFLGDVQRAFYEEMTAMLREAGYQGLVSPSNWKTANDRLLMDLEHYTYAAGDIIDRHKYYSPVAKQESFSWKIVQGDQHVAFSILADPSRSPTNVRQLKGYPSAMSEFQWVNHNPAGVEAALVAAAYFSLTDFDVPVWFALPNTMWDSRNLYRQWMYGRPSQLGQSPGAALLFRRGDVAEAPVVVQEARPRTEIERREPADIMPDSGFDVTRDSAAKRRSETNETLDPLAMMVGKVEFRFDADKDFVAPDLDTYIDRERGRVRSATGEVVTDWQNGLTTIDTPRAQGMSGFLRANGSMRFGDVTLASRNAFGALLVIALDGKPLSESERILVQAGAIDRPTGFVAKPVPMEVDGRTFAGHRIDATGGLPWQVEEVEAVLTLHGMADRVETVTVLDPELRERERLEGEVENGDYILQLPRDSLYSIVELGRAAPGESTEKSAADPAVGESER